MKKILIPLIISMLCFMSLRAQDVYYGPKVGGNLSHIFYNGDDELYSSGKMRLSSHFGVFTEFVFTDFISLQPELLFSIKGDKFISDADESYDYVYKYLSLPIMFKYYVTKEISVEVGPQVAYLLSAKNLETSELYSSEYGDEEASIDLKENMQVYDVGAAAGVGYLTKTGFYLSARYTLGLINVDNSEGENANSFKNGTFQLSAGFSFR